jgi:Fusaric acid resistance protein-like
MRTGSQDDSFMKLWTWDEKNLPSITHAIRTALAATASVIIARLVQMPEAYWAAIATLVVMQSTLGATLTLSIGRIVATAVGASVGAIEAKFFEANLVAYAVAIFLVGLRPSRFVWKRPRIATRALRSLSSFSFRAWERRGRSLCIDSLKSQSESSSPSPSWRCGQNINGLHPMGPPNSAHE